MALIIFILLIPITFLVGQMYYDFIDSFLSPGLKFGTSLGNYELDVFAIQSVFVVFFTALLFYILKSRFIGVIKSELLILFILWVIVLFFLMNPIMILPTKEFVDSLRFKARGDFLF